MDEAAIFLKVKPQDCSIVKHTHTHTYTHTHTHINIYIIYLLIVLLWEYAFPKYNINIIYPKKKIGI